MRLTTTSPAARPTAGASPGHGANMTTIILAIAAALGVTVPDVPSNTDSCNGGLMDCAEG